MIEIISGKLGTQYKLVQGGELVMILSNSAPKLTLRMLKSSIVVVMMTQAVQE